MHKLTEKLFKNGMWSSQLKDADQIITYYLNEKAKDLFGYPKSLSLEIINEFLDLKEKTLEEKFNEYSGKLIVAVDTDVKYVVNKKVTYELAQIANEHFKSE